MLTTESFEQFVHRSGQKSPLSPPFDKAQGMLFQSGVKLQRKTIPPLKMGDRGGFSCDCCNMWTFLNELQFQEISL
jgi:hypothetical protein